MARSVPLLYLLQTLILACTFYFAHDEPMPQVVSVAGIFLFSNILICLIAPWKSKRSNYREFIMNIPLTIAYSLTIFNLQNDVKAVQFASIQSRYWLIGIVIMGCLFFLLFIHILVLFITVFNGLFEWVSALTAVCRGEKIMKVVRNHLKISKRPKN